MRRLAIVVLGAGLAVGAATVPAQADDSATSPKASPVDVVEVTGLVDPIVVDFIERSITAAEKDGDQALVLQMNTAGATVSDARHGHACVSHRQRRHPCHDLGRAERREGVRLARPTSRRGRRHRHGARHPHRQLR